MSWKVSKTSCCAFMIKCLWTHGRSKGLAYRETARMLLVFPCQHTFFQFGISVLWGITYISREYNTSRESKQDFNSPHNVQKMAFNEWWEEGHSSVSPFRAKSLLVWDPTRQDFQAVRAEVLKPKRKLNYSPIGPRRYLAAQGAQEKLGTCFRGQMIFGFSWFCINQQRDLCLYRDINSDESCFCNGNIYKNCCIVQVA